MPVQNLLHDVPCKLLEWYRVQARTLPWRVPPGSEIAPDPYAVWLSEVMLQQTTVAAVKSYYAKFLAIWPTVHDLAAAQDSEVMAAWAGLGYYARARNLLACARAVVYDHGGQFPDSYDALRSLPGLGDYTAASVAAIAYQQPFAVVDANVERVMARLLAIDTPFPAARSAIRQALSPLVPSDRPGDFAQAMMDLGAMICTPRNPACVLCPLVDDCAAHRQGRATAFPNKPAKVAKPERHGIAHWVEREGRVLLVRRPDSGLLGGMLALPGPEWGVLPAGSAVPVAAADMIARVVHVFTHFRLTLDIVAVDMDGASPEGDFIDLAKLGSVGLPTLYAKAVTAVLAHKG